MKFEKSLKKAMKSGDYDGTRTLLKEAIEELGYELVIEHNPFVKMVRNRFNSRFHPRHIKYSNVCNSNCLHFTDPYSEKPEGVVYCLELGNAHYPNRVEMKRLDIFGYGDAWKNDVWWRKSKVQQFFLRNQCLSEKLFMPYGISHIYRIFPDEIGEKLKNK